ncbi:MAG: hypothetical protein V4543_02450 [Bacteroidota bacterium]
MEKTLVLLFFAFVFAGSLSAETGSNGGRFRPDKKYNSLAEKLGLKSTADETRNNRTELFVGLEANTVTGDYSHTIDYGAGGIGPGSSLVFIYYTGKKNRLGVTASVGYNANIVTSEKTIREYDENGMLTGYNIESERHPVKTLPLNLGLRYTFPSKFYFSGEAGYAYHIVKESSAARFISGYSSASGAAYVQTGSFTASPALGGVIKTGSLDLDLSLHLRVMILANGPTKTRQLNLVGIRIAVGIPMGRH